MSEEINTNGLYMCFHCGEGLADNGGCRCPKCTAEEAKAARFLGGDFHEIYRNGVFIARFFNGKGMSIDEFMSDLNATGDKEANSNN